MGEHIRHVVRSICAQRGIEADELVVDPDTGGFEFTIKDPLHGRGTCVLPADRLRYLGANELVDAIALEINLALHKLRGDDVLPMVFVGKLRIYFNRHGAAPLVWCVATNDWEIAVAGVAISAPVKTVYRKKATPDDEDGKPSAWLETSGTLTVIGGMAHIKGGG